VGSASGLTRKAIRSRVDRGSLRAVLRDGVRRIPRSDLVRAGLIVASGEAGAGSSPAEAAPLGAAAPGVIVGELLDRLERQAGELAMRLLEREAESLRVRAGQEHERADRLESELHELRARLTTAEAVAAPQPRRRWRWFGGGPVQGNPATADG
jgi:hypothetical protein